MLPGAALLRLPAPSGTCSAPAGSVLLKACGWGPHCGCSLQLDEEAAEDTADTTTVMRALHSAFMQASQWVLGLVTGADAAAELLLA